MLQSQLGSNRPLKELYRFIIKYKPTTILENKNDQFTTSFNTIYNTSFTSKELLSFYKDVIQKYYTDSFDSELMDIIKDSTLTPIETIDKQPDITYVNKTYEYVIHTRNRVNEIAPAFLKLYKQLFKDFYDKQKTYTSVYNKNNKTRTNKKVELVVKTRPS
jgi:chlorite dismutase